MFTLVQTAYAAEEGLTIHLAPEVVGNFFGLPITSTLLTVWLAMGVLVVFAVLVKSSISLMPNKLQIVFEALIGGVHNYMADVLENRDLATKFFPLIMTIFLFILTMNWIGMLPGMDSIGIYEHAENANEAAAKLIPFFHSPATDLNITIGFAVVAFVSIEFAGILLLGFGKYFGKFFNFSSPLNFSIGLMELISELARLIAFSFRLFGNVFAGETLLLVVAFLATPYFLPIPLIAYEFFVGFIQAFIFAILTLYFIKIAVEPPHAH